MVHAISFSQNLLSSVCTFFLLLQRVFATPLFLQNLLSSIRTFFRLLQPVFANTFVVFCGVLPGTVQLTPARKLQVVHLNKQMRELWFQLHGFAAKTWQRNGGVCSVNWVAKSNTLKVCYHCSTSLELSDSHYHSPSWCVCECNV